MLRLRWRYPHLGRQRSKSLDLEDTLVNRSVAQQRALQIQQDIATQNYDPTLVKYWGEDVQGKTRLTVVELFERFIDHKPHQVENRTLEKYRGLLGHLKKSFKQKPVASVTTVKANAFIQKLSQQLQPITVRERLIMLKSFWDWAIKQRIADTNPWEDLRFKVPPKQRARPYLSKEDAEALA